MEAGGPGVDRLLPPEAGDPVLGASRGSPERGASRRRRRHRRLLRSPGRKHLAPAAPPACERPAKGHPDSARSRGLASRAAPRREWVGRQGRERKEGGREGEGDARPRGGGALSRGLPGSLAAAVVMSAMLAMAQGADRAGERRI